MRRMPVNCSSIYVTFHYQKSHACPRFRKSDPVNLRPDSCFGSGSYATTAEFGSPSPLEGLAPDGVHRTFKNS